MRVALLADIHANLEALEACLDDAQEAGAEVFDYGEAVPWVTRQDQCLTATAGPNAISLWTRAETHGRPPPCTSTRSSGRRPRSSRKPRPARGSLSRPTNALELRAP